MAARALDLEVLRKGRPADSFSAHGDPEDMQWMQKRLAGWLTAGKWSKPLWADFEMTARDKGKSKVLAKVRAV